MEQKTKHCAHCGKDKSVTEFYKDSHTKDGLQSWCKECSNSRSRNRRAKVADIDWNQVRIKAAIAALPQCIKRSEIYAKGDYLFNGSPAQHAANLACQYADALIEILKRKES